MDQQTVVLVEGASDEVALATLAVRSGRDLDAEGVTIVSIGGATSIGRFLTLFGPGGVNYRLSGLCDVGEERFLRRGLHRVGIGGSDLDRAGLEALGFFVCDADLEDEMIRALGATQVEDALRDEGELRSFRIFQQQPAQLGRDVGAQLRRFMGTRSGRKSHYGRVLADRLDLDDLPTPLRRLLDFL